MLQGREVGAMGSMSWESIVGRIIALDESLRNRANDAARRAGLDQSRNVWTNAIIARESGHPWSGVDYSALRDAMRIDAARERVWDLRSRLWRAYERKHYPGRAALRADEIGIASSWGRV